MRSGYRIIAVLSLLVVSAATSYAQSARRTVIAIPFDFVVGQKTLAAGTYRIEPFRRDSNTTLQIQNTDTGATAFVITNPIETGSTRREAKLVFQNFEGRYVLAQVYPAGESGGRQLVGSQRRRGASDSLAQNNGTPQIVTVVARPK